jgi:hypothetical protein
MEQRYILVALGIILLLILIIVNRKDTYTFDPLYETSMPSDPSYQSYFKSVHADPELSIVNARYQRACENCKRPMDYLNHPMTPRNCEQCRSFVLGHDITGRGQGVL